VSSRLSTDFILRAAGKSKKQGQREIKHREGNRV
jgi:hypothetical protein